jgi:TIR domain
MRIFVSHASSDASLAAELVQELEREGLSVRFPSESILPGDNWSLERGNALQECEVMVALFSRSADSTVLRDVQFALTSGNYRGRIVPVLIDFVTFTAGTEVPWIVLKLDPIYLNAPDYDLTPVVKRVQQIADAGHHASA